MSALALLGAAGLGLTWGWMLGWLAPAGRRFRSALAAVAATLLSIATVVPFAGAEGAGLAGGAVLLALLLHLGQRRRWRAARR